MEIIRPRVRAWFLALVRGADAARRFSFYAKSRAPFNKDSASLLIADSTSKQDLPATHRGQLIGWGVSLVGTDPRDDCGLQKEGWRGGQGGSPNLRRSIDGSWIKA